MQLKVYNTQAKEVGKLELSDAVFGCEYKPSVIHQVVVAYSANQRQGTKSALTRTEVRGGGAKPYRQKGTGRARQGSIRAPQYKKGGIVFAPKPRDFSKKVNKKVKTAAFCSAISSKVANDELKVLDKLELAEGKTKLMAQILDNFNFNKRTLLIIDDADQMVIRASGNINYLTITVSDLVNVYQLVANTNILATAAAMSKIQERMNVEEATV